MLSEFALYSDRLFMAAVSVYVLAMVLHGAEYAVHRSAKAVLIGAGGPALDAEPDEPRPDAPGARSRAERFGRMGVSLVVLGAVLHAASIVLRGLAAQRWPLGNMYEFTSAICLAAIAAWLVMLRRSPAARPVGLFVLLPVVILLFLGGTVLYAPAAPVMPALQSYWLVVHVTTVSIASGLLMVPGVASLLFLLRRSGRLAGFAEKLPSAAGPDRLAHRLTIVAARRLAGFADTLPSADALDRLAYRLTIVAFPLYTFAIMAGAIWAEAAWGRFWGWDPKETVAFVAWVIYAAYLHARATAGWRNGPAAWVNVAGFAAVVFNFFFINMVVSGLHSYAGLG